MPRKNSHLTHHEELRLDYLRKNIYYLNDNEQNELDYLEQRARGLVGPSRRASRPKPSYSELPSYREEAEPELSRMSLEEDEELLPVYPREERRRRKRRPKAKQERPAAKTFDPEPKIRKPRKKVNWFKRTLKLAIWAILLTLAGMTFMFVKGYNNVSSEKV